MKKVVVFTEGQSELIFTRHLLTQIIGYENISFECFNLVSDKMSQTPYKRNPPNALIHYLIVNVGTDERVLSAIIERQEKYISQGYEIVGLRDMYSELYKKKSKQIDQKINQYFIESYINQINALNNANQIHFYFAVMELESWFLGMHKVFEKLSSALTPKSIKDNLGFDIEAIDPELSFFQPSTEFKQVLKLANIDYDKHRSEVEGIVSKIDNADIDYLASSGKCRSFSLFLSEIQREFSEASA